MSSSKGQEASLGQDRGPNMRKHKADIIAYLTLEIVLAGKGGPKIRRGSGDFTQVYRPCRISEVVGNDDARKIITKAFDQNRIPHSFLFHGLSGTGKTTMARIIEMGLNCKEGPTCEPCCDCSYCRSIIDRKGNLAIREINAVEKNKDELKEILKELDCLRLRGALRETAKACFWSMNATG